MAASVLSKMCGICGMIDYNENSKVDESTLNKICAAMIHRGPDDAGVYVDMKNPSVGLGHRRLSIIDLSSAGHQPMSNEDETVWLVFNGEIYNYKELRINLENKGHRFKSNTDTETLIHLYEEYGIDCVKHLRGMFAFAIWDKKQRRLLLARDRLGKKPLLYSYRDGRFIFASEFSALLASGLIEKDIKNEAIHYYLNFGYIPAPVTIYKGVFKLLPAHILVLKDKGLSITPYWELDYSKKIDISEEEAQAELLRLLGEAVKIRLYSDVALGVFLSGGIDSSAVVALMSKASNKRIDTFSIGFDESAYNELSYARKVAACFNTRHNEFIVRPKAMELLPKLIEHYGEPYADSSCLPTYYVSQLTRQYVTVALNGDGGDEAFAGYERYSAVMLSEGYRHIPLLIRKLIRFITYFLPSSNEPKDAVKRLKKFLYGTELPFPERYFYWAGIFSKQQKDRLLSADFKDRSDFDAYKELENFLGNPSDLKLIDKLLRTDALTYLPNDLLVKVDIVSMANSLEVRSPFLDQRVVEFAASLPQEYKLKNGIKKYILKKALKNLLPRDNIYRKKMGFGVPVSKWLRKEMKDYLKINLLSAKCLGRGYFEAEAVKELVEAHINGRADHGNQLWALLMLELWHQRFMD